MAAVREPEMIEITNGINRICMGTDTLVPLAWEIAAVAPGSSPVRSPTGARVTLDFSRDAPLPAGERVRVLYDFAGDGVREAVGVAIPIRAVTRWGQSVVYHYRLSHWIVPAALLQFVESNVRQRTDEREIAQQHADKHARASVCIHS